MTVVRWQHLRVVGLLFLPVYVWAFYEKNDLTDEDWEDIEKHHDMDSYEQITPEDMKGLHKKFDANGDGTATFEEITKYAETMRGVIATKDSMEGMAELDENNDSKLSLKEVLKSSEDALKEAETDEDKKEAQLQLEHDTEKFHAVDKNADGHLQIEEVHGMIFPETNDKALEIAMKYEMKHSDKNGDGKLSLKEYLAMPGLDDDGGDKKEDFKMHDLDGDGLLNCTELVGKEGGRQKMTWAVEHLVKIADINKDGGVTPEELVNVRKLVAKHETLGWNLMEWIEHEEL